MSGANALAAMMKLLKETPMDNGCPKCEELAKVRFISGGVFSGEPCIDCRLEQAEHDVLRDMNRVEQLKKEKEQDELSNDKR